MVAVLSNYDGKGERVCYLALDAAARRWLHAEERGSIAGVSNSAGTSIAINAHDEYGIPASTNMGRFAYTGQTWLPEVGLYYYSEHAAMPGASVARAARMYSPTLGRFMQTDPIGYKDGINWYDYVDGDPVNRVDPTGLAKKCVMGGRRLLGAIFYVLCLISGEEPPQQPRPLPRPRTEQIEKPLPKPKPKPSPPPPPPSPKPAPKPSPPAPKPEPPKPEPPKQLVGK